MSDTSYKLKDAPREYDAKPLEGVCSKGASRASRAKIKKLWADYQKATARVGDTFEKIREFRQNCPHPIGEVEVHQYNHSDDWAKITWATAYAICGLCKARIPVEEQSWVVSQW